MMHEGEMMSNLLFVVGISTPLLLRRIHACIQRKLELHVYVHDDMCVHITMFICFGLPYLACLGTSK